MLPQRSNNRRDSRRLDVGPLPQAGRNAVRRYQALIEDYLHAPSEETRFAAYLLGRALDHTAYGSVGDLVALHNQALRELLSAGPQPAGPHPLDAIHGAGDLLDDLFAGWTVNDLS
jgi:hypothetical protein